jgi:hypothetical protein
VTKRLLGEKLAGIGSRRQGQLLKG